MYSFLFLPAICDIILGIHTLQKFYLQFEEYVFIILLIINGVLKLFSILHQKYFCVYQNIIFCVQHIMMYKHLLKINQICTKCTQKQSEQKLKFNIWFGLISFMGCVHTRYLYIIHVIILLTNIKFAFTILINNSQKKTPFEFFFIFYILFGFFFILSPIFYTKFVHSISIFMFSYSSVYIITSLCYQREINHGYNCTFLKNQYYLPYFN